MYESELSSVALSEIAVVKEAVEGLDSDKHFHFIMRRMARMEALNPQGLSPLDMDHVSGILWHLYEIRWGDEGKQVMAEHGLLFSEEDVINNLLEDS